MSENHQCPYCGTETTYQSMSGGKEWYCPNCDETGYYSVPVVTIPALPNYRVIVKYNDDTNSFDLYEQWTGTFLESMDAMSIHRSDVERICKAAFEAGRQTR